MENRQYTKERIPDVLQFERGINPLFLQKLIPFYCSFSILF